MGGSLAMLFSISSFGWLDLVALQVFIASIKYKVLSGKPLL